MNYNTAHQLYQGKLTDGNPAQGIDPSLDSAEHINAITDEIINVLASAGISPQVNTLNQLSQAIAILIAAADFAPTNHNHAGVYSPTSHSHAGVYSPVSHDHAGVYSPVNHNHAGVYSPTTHNHDSAYAATSHTHSGYKSTATEGVAPFSTSTFDVRSQTSELAFVSVGPTESGASKTWAVLDQVPSAAKFILVHANARIYNTDTPSSYTSSSRAIYTREYGTGSGAPSDTEEICSFKIGLTAASALVDRHIAVRTIIPVDAANRFQTSWEESGVSGGDLKLRLIGWI